MTCPHLTFWLLTRRPRMAWAQLRYSRRMAKLHREYIPARRHRHLTHMAMLAEDISGYEHREPRTTEWMVTAELLRAAAASEYGEVLDGLCLTSDRELWDSGQRQTDTWDALWIEMTLARGDRSARAAVYRELTGLTAAATGTGVLRDLEATELAAAQRSGDAALRMLASLPVRRGR